MVDITTLDYVGNIMIQSVKGTPIYRVNELELVIDPVDGKSYIWGNIYG